MGAGMRLLVAAVGLLTLAGLFGSIAALAVGWSYFQEAQRELRCERPGAVIANAEGKICDPRNRGSAAIPTSADLERRLAK
jgi:hypothetical protein